MKIKISDYVWKYIAHLGIKHVFFFPGGGAMHLLDSLGRNDDIMGVTLLHEQSCAMAAETYSRISFNMGAALVTTGPGGTNAITGVAAAWLESTPMIVISGQAKLADLKGDTGVRQKGNQELGITDIVKSITKYSAVVRNPLSIKYELDKAVFWAKEGRPGPVWLDIPLDVQGMILEENDFYSFNRELSKDEERCYLDNKVSKIVGLLQVAKKPVIIAGQGIERNNGGDCFRELIHSLRIPTLTSWIATELLPYDDEYNFGKPGMVAPRYSNFVIQNADLLIAIGTRLDSSMVGYNQMDFAPNAKKVIVDIDPFELNKFAFCVEEKICIDASELIAALLGKTDTICKGWAEWVDQCKEWKKNYPVIQEIHQKKGNHIDTYHFIDLLSDSLNNDDVVIPGSSGAAIDVFWLCFKNKKGQRTLSTGALGSMGYGLPAAIGACYASGKRTICVEGDGSIQLNIQELISVVHNNLPIKIFVMNNGGYMSIKNMQSSHFESNFVGANPESGLPMCDIEKVASSMGLKVYRVDNHDDLKEVIDEVLENNNPALCNVMLGSTLSVQPRVVSRVTKEGSMESGSLGRMWPYLDEENPL